MRREFSLALLYSASLAFGAFGVTSSASYADESQCVLKNVQGFLDLSADRAFEWSQAASRKSYRASDVEVFHVRQAHPQLSKNIDSLASALKKEVFLPKAKTLGGIPKLSQLENELNEKSNLKIKNAIIAVWNRMNDEQAFARYIKVLAEDAAVEMKKQGNPKSIEALRQGKLTGTGVLKALMRRQKAKGETNFSIVRSWDADRFHEAAARGPVFDKAARDSEHSMTAHLLQRDYVDDVVWGATEGHPDEFWKYINGPGRQRVIWEMLFDQPQGVDSPGSPEWYFSALVELFDHR